MNSLILDNWASPSGDPSARGARMVRAMDLAQVDLGEMGVNLGGRDVTVAEHLLHRAQIGAAFQQMGRDAMAQRVRAAPCHARLPPVPSLERPGNPPAPRHA